MTDTPSPAGGIDLEAIQRRHNDVTRFNAARLVGTAWTAHTDRGTLLAEVRALRLSQSTARQEAYEDAAKIADAHEGAAERDRHAKGQKFISGNENLGVEIAAEERGEDIASTIIAAAIRARAGEK